MSLCLVVCVHVYKFVWNCTFCFRCKMLCSYRVDAVDLTADCSSCVFQGPLRFRLTVKRRKLIKRGRSNVKVRCISAKFILAFFHISKYAVGLQEVGIEVRVKSCVQLCCVDVRDQWEDSSASRSKSQGRCRSVGAVCTLLSIRTAAIAWRHGTWLHV